MSCSKKIQCNCIKDERHKVVALMAGYSEAEINNMLKKHPEWYRAYEEHYE